MALEFKGLTIILANATTKEGKVNFEGIGSTGCNCWLAHCCCGFLKNKSGIYLIF
jgi:hypothetical protein